jgi:hypothetical protein
MAKSMLEKMSKTIGELDERSRLRLQQLEDERQARWRRLQAMRLSQENQRREAEAARWQEMLHRANSVEALSWLQGPPGKHRSFSGGSGSDDEIAGTRLLRLVQSLYGYGAVTVTAVGVAGLGEPGAREDTDILLIELPEEQAARTRLFRWAATFARKEGCAPEPTKGRSI